MSTLRISFATQVLDFSPLTRGVVSVRFNDGNQNYDLFLSLVTGVAGTRQFQEVAYVNGSSGEDEDQAINYRNAFNRDYRTVGLLPGAANQRFNLMADVDGSDVVITAINGTFDQANCTYSGNVLVIGFLATNTPQTSFPSINAVISATGDCDTIDYNAAASGGLAPYNVTLNGSPVLTSWDGSTAAVSLPRGTSSKLVMTDSNSDVVSRTINVPRRLTPGEFTIDRVQYLNTINLTVQWGSPVSGVGPLEYSLEVQGSSVGATWQASPSFPGVLSGTYEMFIRDQFGCSVQKTIIVSQTQDPSMWEPPDYFEVMPGNSVIFSESALFSNSVKKNFDNTLSYNELSPIRYTARQYFDPSDVIAVQFKSSYDYHIVTLMLTDGTKTDVPPVTIQTNLGVVEKVDCVTFPLEVGGTGVYFNGGNEYAPGTANIIGASPHTTFLPYWVAENQIVSIDGLGVFAIQGTGYDSDRQKDYFIIDTSIAAEVADMVQVTYNKQIYNLFEFRFSIPSGKKGRIVIEKGQDFSNVVGNPWISELLVAREDSHDDLLIEWGDVRNKGGLVFQSGIKFFRRMEGSFRPSFRGESKTADTDSRSYNLSQSAYLQYVLTLEGLTAKEAYQMCIASGLDGFAVNNLPLVRPEFPQIEALGASNLYNFTCNLHTGADDLSIQRDEVVLDVSTGVEGGGATAKQPYTLPLYDNRIRLKTTGGFVTVSGDFVAIE